MNSQARHISKCINWCQRFRVPYNKVNLTSNIFLSSRSNESSPYRFRSSSNVDDDDDKEKES